MKARSPRSDSSGLRAVEIEEITNLYVIHPIGTWLARFFARRGVTPNAVSIIGLVSGVLAAVAYFGYRNLACSLLGFALMIVWHVMDGTDGQLARMTHASSALGKVLDGACDYGTFIAVYTAFALAGGGWGGWMWPLVAVAGLAHATQAAAYEAQREEYGFWRGRAVANGESSMNAVGRTANEHPARSAVSSWIYRWAYRAYRSLQIRAAGSTLRTRERLIAVVAERPEQTRAIIDRYLRTFAPLVRRWSILSSNYRTLALFVAAAFEVPQAYFLFEIVGLSAALVALNGYTKAKYERFFVTVRHAD